jgi:DNA replication protein DnaC
MEMTLTHTLAKFVQEAKPSAEQTSAVSQDELRKYQAAFRKRISEADVPEHYREITLEQVNQFRSHPAKVEALNAVETLIDKGKVNGCNGILLSGNFGSGKTTLATFAFMSIMWKNPNMTAVWAEVGWLVRELQSGYRDGSSFDKLKKVADSRLLLLDDLGTLDKAEETADRKGLVKDLLSRRTNSGRPTLITTNLTAAELALQFGERPFERLLELCHFVRMEGQNMRREIKKSFK